MIIHGATDGVALVASNWTGNEGLEWIIFFGIFLHKLPAAFGLSACIVNNPEFSKYKSLLVIALFTASAPVGGFLTLTVLQIFEVGQDGESVLPGVLLLVSGGTILYVSLCHIIPECMGSSENNLHGTNGSFEINGSNEEDEMNLTENLRSDGVSKQMQIGLMCVGLLVPLVLTYAVQDE